jgi:hypothetical protein
MQAENQTRILLIVSDLHLSEGWDEKTKKLSRNEDFFFGQSFQRFLNFYIEKGTKGKCRVNLIIAGDFVDLLQVISLPDGDTVEGEAITPRERDFGLGTSPKKSCWKLRKLMNGHWILFQARYLQFVNSDRGSTLACSLSSGTWTLLAYCQTSFSNFNF